MSNSIFYFCKNLLFWPLNLLFLNKRFPWKALDIYRSSATTVFHCCWTCRCNNSTWRWHELIWSGEENRKCDDAWDWNDRTSYFKKTRSWLFDDAIWKTNSRLKNWISTTCLRGSFRRLSEPSGLECLCKFLESWSASRLICSADSARNDFDALFLRSSRIHSQHQSTKTGHLYIIRISKKFY